MPYTHSYCGNSYILYTFITKRHVQFFFANSRVSSISDQISSKRRATRDTHMLMFRASLAASLLYAASASICQFQANSSQAGSCFSFDLTRVAEATWALNTSTCPEDCNLYRLAAPCRSTSKSECGGSSAPPDAPAYQVSNSDGSCLPIGSGLDADISMSPIYPIAAQSNDDAAPIGLRVVYSGGADGRRLVWRLMCNDNDQGGPDGQGVVENPRFTYTATWFHKGFCSASSATGACSASPVPPAPPTPTPPAPAPAPPAWGTVPLPTPAQLAYYQSEMRALIHFNMATFIQDGDPGCNKNNWNKLQPGSTGPSSDPATFNPAKLNFSQWLESFDALGVRNAVMTAKHGCGHLLWPTKTTLPDGSPYAYAVGKEKSAIKFDLVAEFRKVMSAAGVDIGFYYSLTNNFYLNVFGKVAKGSQGLLPGQVDVTQDQFEALAWAQLSELWQNYGNYSEVWLDGGYPISMLKEIKENLSKWQPGATAFNGLGQYDPATNETSITKSAVRWIGTESGLPNADDIWSTASQERDFSGIGDPNSPVFAPPGCDTVLQSPKGWFFKPSAGVRSLEDLIHVYHESVGRNCVIELDFAIDRDGLVAASHAAQYRKFGDWIKGCYGGPPGFNNQYVAATKDNEIAGNQTSGKPFTLGLSMGDTSRTVDRVVIMEDLGFGQRIRGFTVEARSPSGAWTLVGTGKSVGNKRIQMFSNGAMAVKELRLNVTANQAAPVHVKFFGAFAPCATS